METKQAGVSHVPPGEGRSIWIVGDTYTFKAVGEDTGRALTLLEGEVSPQLGPPPHIHHHEDEFFYVLEGELEFLDNDRTFTASAGSFVYIPRGALHRFKNVGETNARMLVFFTLAGMENFFFEAASRRACPCRREAPRPRSDRRRSSVRSLPPQSMAWSYRCLQKNKQYRGRASAPPPSKP